MKKILNIMFLLTFCLCLGGCSREQRLTYEDEYFLYSYTINSYDENDDKYIYLIGLTEKGKDQEILIIPSNVKGREVFIKTSRGLWGNDTTYFESVNLKRIYVPDNIEIVYNIHAPYETKIFALSAHISPLTEPESGILYINREAYEKGFKNSERPANVSYKWNYEESPNSGYYWIDNYYSEIISYIPTNPTREGYIFDGWYKEPECINKWDFDNDIVPGTEWESGVIVEYQETILYAKWIEC